MDRREAILARLESIYSGIEGIRTVLRNAPTPPAAYQPAIIVFDGDEESDEDDPKMRPVQTPRRVAMTPETLISLGSRSEEVGPKLNVLRMAIIKAVTTDGELVNLVGSSGAIRYMGCATGLGSGKTMAAEMIIVFAFHYFLNPAEL